MNLLQNMKRINLLIGVLLLQLLASCGMYNDRYKVNTQTKSGEAEALYIPTNATFNQVVDSLQKYNLLKDVELFKKSAERNDYGQNIKSGKYLIEPNWTNKQLLSVLKSGRQVPVKVTFNNVRSIYSLAGKVSKQIEADSIALVLYLTDDKMLQDKYGLDAANIGILFLPNTYEFYWNTTPEKFVDKMKKEYDKFWNAERLAKAEELKMTPREVAVLASIVQAEQTSRKSEWPTIAGLYINRLNKNMLLQSDPTVIFAWNDPSIRRVLFRHLEIDSPYNTYKYTGLPPGPILIPEPGVVDAVLNYEKNNYYYMCAKEDLSGAHNFAKTLSEHSVNAQKYQRALNAAGIR